MQTDSQFYFFSFLFSFSFFFFFYKYNNFSSLADANRLRCSRFAYPGSLPENGDLSINSTTLRNYFIHGGTHLRKRLAFPRERPRKIRNSPARRDRRLDLLTVRLSSLGNKVAIAVRLIDIRRSRRARKCISPGRK